MTIAKLSVEGFLNATPAPEIEARRLAGRKRRALVLTNESARHPFRASLPPHVTAVAKPRDPQIVRTEHGRDESAQGQMLWRLTRDDVRGFATTYFAVFAAVLAFIL